jgi:hypothetical protein
MFLKDRCKNKRADREFAIRCAKTTGVITGVFVSAKGEALCAVFEPTWRGARAFPERELIPA